MILHVYLSTVSDISLAFMKKLKILSAAVAALALLSLSLNDFAQESPYEYSPKLSEELKTLEQAALASDYAYKQVAYLTSNIGPRLSGSPQAARAVEYVAEEMRRQGFEVRLEKCT